MAIDTQMRAAVRRQILLDAVTAAGDPVAVRMYRYLSECRDVDVQEVLHKAAVSLLEEAKRDANPTE